MVCQIPKISSKHQRNGHEIYHRSNKVKGPWRKIFRIFGDLKVFLNNYKYSKNQLNHEKY